MSAIFKLLLCAALLCMFCLEAIQTTAVARDDDDFRMKFGKEIGTAMRVISMNMLQTNAKSAEDFYNALQTDMRPDEEQTNTIKAMLAELNETKSKIPENINDMDTIDMLKLFQDFILKHFMKIFRMEIGDMAKNDEQREVISVAVGEFAAIEGESADNAIKAMHEKWSNMFKAIPVEEMQKHGEYEQINEAMEKLSKIERAHMKFPREQNDAFLEMFMQMVNFFNWSEWKHFFEMSNH